jgi:uncharacterized membrane protein
MKRLWHYLVNAVLGGMLVLLPIYLAVLLVLKATQSLARLVKPLAMLLPEWFPAENILAFLFVILVCFVVGVAVRTNWGKRVRARFEVSLFERIPGYKLVRSLTQQISGESQSNAWKPALVEIEEALVPAFIIEELEDGRFTVFVPSVPTPLAGAVYILTPERVHALNVPFTDAVKAVSHWGSGAKKLVASMAKGHVGARPLRNDNS